MSWTIFFFLWTSRISRCFLSGNFFQTESRVSCPREFRKGFRKRCRQCRNRDQWTWCQGTFLSVKKDLPQHLSNIGSFGNQELDQSCVSSRDRKFTRKFLGTLLESQFSSLSPFSSFCSAPLLARTSLLNAGMSQKPCVTSQGGLFFGRVSEPSLPSKSAVSTHRSISLRERTVSTLISMISRPRWLHLQFQPRRKWDSLNPFGRCVWFSAASCSQRQPASSSVVNLWQDTDLRNTGNFVRRVESFPSVERTMSKGRRDIFSTIKGENYVKWSLHEYFDKHGDDFSRRVCSSEKIIWWLRLKLDRKQC